MQQHPQTHTQHPHPQQQAAAWLLRLDSSTAERIDAAFANAKELAGKCTVAVTRGKDGCANDYAPTALRLGDGLMLRLVPDLDSTSARIPGFGLGSEGAQHRAVKLKISAGAAAGASTGSSLPQGTECKLGTTVFEPMGVLGASVVSLQSRALNAAAAAAAPAAAASQNNSAPASEKASASIKVSNTNTNAAISQHSQPMIRQTEKEKEKEMEMEMERERDREREREKQIQAQAQKEKVREREDTRVVDAETRLVERYERRYEEYRLLRRRVAAALRGGHVVVNSQRERLLASGEGTAAEAQMLQEIGRGLDMCGARVDARRLIALYNELERLRAHIANLSKKDL